VQHRYQLPNLLVIVGIGLVARRMGRKYQWSHLVGLGKDRTRWNVVSIPWVARYKYLATEIAETECAAFL